MLGGVDATVTPERMRATLGRFCTGVTVVSTEFDGVAHAMTANAFVSVSLDPPLVLVSIDQRARMHEILARSRRYGVSVLSADQERVALHFAGRPMPDPGGLLEPAAEAGPPLIHGAIAHVVCELHATVPAGDHTLYLGLVEELRSRPGAPLLFHAGDFGRIDVEQHESRWTAW
ncbi:MAG: flavin reductase domain protein FMN-binding [Solirubrobacterales bacterium]|nr:flavin reductase domain protein FMN-binding [Solirubrobacterales bacterium]